MNRLEKYCQGLAFLVLLQIGDLGKYNIQCMLTRCLPKPGSRVWGRQIVITRGDGGVVPCRNGWWKWQSSHASLADTAHQVTQQDRSCKPEQGIHCPERFCLRPGNSGICRDEVCMERRRAVSTRVNYSSCTNYSYHKPCLHRLGECRNQVIGV